MLGVELRGLIWLLALALAAVAAVVMVGGSERSQELVLRLENASQLVEGNEVKVGGVPVGSVEQIALAPDSLAEVRVRVEDERLVPLHEGTRAVVRMSSLSSVTERYIALEPGPNDAPPLPDGATLRTEDTQAAVDLDAVIATLDADTRRELQRLSRGAAVAVGGRDLNPGLAALNPAVAQLEGTLQELTRDRAAFERLVVSGASWISAVADREDELGVAFAASADVADALANRSEQLEQLLLRAPGTLAQATGTLSRTAETLDAIEPAVREAVPVAPRVSRLLADLDPTLQRLRPAIDVVDPLLRDLRGWLATAPALRRSALPAFRSASGAVERSLPLVTGARPYVPDLVLGATNGFGGSAAGPYDANGGYARIGAMTGAFSTTGAGTILPTAPTGYRPGNTERCPGAATQVAPDGSNRFDPGIPCDESQRP